VPRAVGVVQEQFKMQSSCTPEFPWVYFFFALIIRNYLTNDRKDVLGGRARR
jgi:hypothetical protein